MGRYHLRQVLWGARLSRFEEHSLLVGVLLMGAAVVFMVARHDPGGSARLLGMIGLGVLGLCGVSRGVRLYRAPTPPRSVPSSAVTRARRRA